MGVAQCDYMESKFDHLFHPVVYATFVLFCLISKVFTPFLCSRYVRVYCKSNATKKVYFEHRCAGVVYGLVVVILSGIVCLFIQDGSINDYLYLKSKLGIFALQISLGYFSADLIMVVAEYNRSCQWYIMSIIHHLMCLVGLSLCMVNDGKWMVVFLLTCTHEITQPFLYLRWIFKESKTPKSSQRFFIVESGLTLCYLYRCVSIAWCWYALFINITAETDPTFADLSLPLYDKICMLSLYLLYTGMSVNWTYNVLVEYMPYING